MRGRGRSQALLCQPRHCECNTPPGAIHITMASLRQGKGMDAVTEMRQHAFERVARIGNAMQKNHGDSGALSAFNVGKSNPVGNLNVLDGTLWLRPSNQR